MPLCTVRICGGVKKGTMRKFVVSYHNLLKRTIGLSKYESTSATCAFFSVPSCGEILRGMMKVTWCTDLQSGAHGLSVCM